MAGRGQKSLLEDRAELCGYSPANRLGLSHGSTTPGVRENSRGGGQVQVGGPISSSLPATTHLGQILGPLLPTQAPTSLGVAV